MFFISRKEFEREVERRMDKFITDFRRNEEVTRVRQKLEDLEWRINRLEHPIDSPTTCKCGD